MNFSKYIGIPYKHLGRSFEGADCWGLIWLVYKEEKEIILPDDLTYQEFWYEVECKNHVLDGVQSYNKKITVQPPFNIFDVLLFYNQTRSFVDHVGMIIDIDRFMHTYRNSSSKTDKLTGYWNSRLYKGVRDTCLK